VRKRNLYDPQSQDLFSLSRSRLENFLKCPRCFYIDRRLGIEPPPGPPFSINSGVDTLLKREFDLYRARQVAHPYMLRSGINAVPFSHPDLDKWRSNFVGVRVPHVESGFEFFGAVDDIWKDVTTGELIVVDYKATAKDAEVTLDADWQISYKRQMEVYQWLLRRSGFRVKDAGYFVYCNGDLSAPSFNEQMKFRVTVIEYVGNDCWIEAELKNAALCLRHSVPPPPSNGCKQCEYVRSVCEVSKLGSAV
jgi:RecB family exonuclease